MHRYLKPKKYLRYFKNRSIQLASTALQPVEKYLAKKYGEQGIRKYPPVFIIGAPRCGSTLLYKIMTERYRFSFFSNFTARFYRIPICGTWLQGKLGIKSGRGNYEFKYGNAFGLGAPNECGEFWYQWFPKGLHVYIGPNLIDRGIVEQLRWEIGGMSNVSGSPMISKNLYNSMRIAPIVEAIPECFFIVCRRNYVENALSILKGRINNLKHKGKWWSLPPKEVDELLNKDYTDQVAGQVYHIYRQIDEDKKRFGENRFLEVSYEDFCSDVHVTLNAIENFLSQDGCKLESRWDVPNSFKSMHVDGIDPDDREKVTSAVHSFFNK